MRTGRSASLISTIKVFFCLSAIIALALQGRPLTIVTAKENGGKITMQMLEMTITLKRTEVLVGESLPLQVILMNPGTAMVEVPNPEGPTEF